MSNKNQLKREIERKYRKQRKVWMRVSDDFSGKRKVPLKKIIKEHDKLNKLAERYNQLLK